MRHFPITIVALSLILLFKSVQAQEISSVSEARFLTLEYVDRLPKKLLATKSVVFVKMDSPKGYPKGRGDWKSFAEEAHKTFKRTNIDAVAYYYFDDVFSSDASIKAFSETLAKRQISNIILWKKTYKNNSPYYSMAITSFNKEETFIKDGQKAWKVENTEASTCLNTLYGLANRLGLSVKNLMVNDVPEFFASVDVIKGQRYEAFPIDLKSEKLAVVKFKSIVIPETGIDEATRSILTGFNESVAKKNETLDLLMKTYYPFEYGLVAPTLSIKEIRDEGYQFVIGHIGSTGKVLKENLSYKFDEQDTHYISVAWEGERNALTKISAEMPVIKYYFQQTFTKNTYLGTKWDTAANWEDSLRNFLNNLKKEVVQ